MTAQTEDVFYTLTGCVNNTTTILETTTLTLSDARERCATLPRCKGFIYVGKESEDPVEVRFFQQLRCQWFYGQDHICFHIRAPEDREPIVEAILQSQGRVFASRSASDPLRADRSVMLAVVGKNGLLLSHASEKLRADHKIAEVAVMQTEGAIPYVAKVLWQNPDFVDVLVRWQPNMLQHAPDLQSNCGIVLTAIRQNGSALQYASKKLRSDPEVVSAAVEQRADAFVYASDKLREDPNFVQKLMQRNERVLSYASDKLRSDPKFMLALVRKNESFLLHASDTLRADKSFILTVVAEQGDAVRYAWHTCWEDAEIILAASQKDKRAMRHAGKAAWNNRDFVLTMVQKDWRELRHASEEIRSDREIVKLAIAQSPDALQYASESLKEDPEVVFRSYQLNRNIAMQHARATVFEERDFILAVAGVKVPPEWIVT